MITVNIILIILALMLFVTVVEVLVISRIILF